MVAKFDQRVFIERDQYLAVGAHPLIDLEA
jgi:hypothetical protein